MALPANDADLETAFNTADYVTVATDDGNRVDQTAQGQFGLFLFKDDDTAGTNNVAIVTWDGQYTLAPSAQTVYLQVYNRNSTTWETLDSDSATAANTDFNLTGTINGLADYKDGNGWIACRVYQEAV